MSTQGEFCSDRYADCAGQRSSSLAWMSKLLGSVWKMENSGSSNGSQHEEGQGQGQSQGHGHPEPQRPWEGGGPAASSGESIGRNVQKSASHTWRSSSANGGLTQYEPAHPILGVVNHNRGRGEGTRAPGGSQLTHTLAGVPNLGMGRVQISKTSDGGHDLWTRDFPHGSNARSTLNTSDVGVHSSNQPDILRHGKSDASASFIGGERSLSVTGSQSPNLQHRPRCNSSSYASLESDTFHHSSTKHDNYTTTTNYRGFPTTKSTFTPRSNIGTHKPTNFLPQSPFNSNSEGTRYQRTTSFQDIDFACHAQVQPNTHQQFPFQQQKPQTYPLQRPNSSLYLDISGMKTNKSRDPPQLSTTMSRPSSSCRISTPTPTYKDQLNGRDLHDKNYSPSPQHFDVPYTNQRDVTNSRFNGFAQPEHGKPTVSPVVDDTSSLRCTKPQSYYPENHRLPHESYTGSCSSPKYHTLSPVSPSVTPRCSLGLSSARGGSRTLNQQVPHNNRDDAEFSQQPPGLLYNPPSNSANSTSTVENGYPLYHAQSHKHTRQHSTEESKKSAKQPRGAQNLPPCRVCGNKASGLHFGVNTCEACNEFFRRSLKRGANYHCSRNLSCKVWGKKRSPCSSCRYRRCLEVGMSRNRIKTGRYSHRTRAEYAQEIEKNKRHETYEMERERVLSMLETLVENHNRYIRNSSHIPHEDIIRTQEKFLANFKKMKKKRRMRRRKTRDGAGAESTSEEKFRSEVASNTNNSTNCVACNSDSDDDQKTEKAKADKNVKIIKSLGIDTIQNDAGLFLNPAELPSVQTTRNFGVAETKNNSSTSEPSDKGSVVTKTSDLDTVSSVSHSPLLSEVSRSVEPVDRLEERTNSVGLNADHRADTLGDLDPTVQEATSNAEDSDATDSDYFSDCMGLTRLDADITERWLRSYITYAKLVPGFKHLHISDQANLVRLSWFEFWFLGAHRGFNSELKVVMYPIGHTLHESQFTSIFGEEFSAWSFHLADRMCSLRLSPEEMVLMKTVCLLAPDRCELKDTQAVEKMHWAMVSALLHVLEKNRPGDRTIFPKIIGKMVELRTLSAIAMKAHSGALFPDVFPQRPLLGEIVNSNKETP